MFSHSMLRRDAFALLRRAKVSLPLFAGLLLLIHMVLNVAVKLWIIFLKF